MILYLIVNFVPFRTGRILGTINGAGAVQPANPTNSTIIRATAPNVTPLNRLPMSRPQTVLNRTVHSQIQVQRPATTVKPAQVVDLTRPTGPTTTGTNSTTSSNPKTKFPALNVQPKPQDVQANLRRPELDQKVKSLLVMTPAKLTEWLIQQGKLLALLRNMDLLFFSFHFKSCNKIMICHFFLSSF